MHKINRIQIYIVILICVLIQMGPLNNFKLYGVKPDIIMAAVVFFALFLGSGRGLEAGVAAGLFQDILAVDYFWVNTFILAVMGFIVGSVNNKIFKESKKSIFVLVLLCQAFSLSLHYFLEIFLSGNIVINYSAFLISSVIPSSLYTALVSVVLYGFFVSVYHLKEAEDYI